LPLLAIGIVEKVAFNTSHFGAMLGNRMGGGAEAAAFTASSVAMDPLTPHSGQFLISPGLWIGLAITSGIPRRSGPPAPLPGTDLTGHLIR